MDETLVCNVESRITWVRFNRPDKRNCMNPTLNRTMLNIKLYKPGLAAYSRSNNKPA
jgi:hypothetical protein